MGNNTPHLNSSFSIVKIRESNLSHLFSGGEFQTCVAYEALYSNGFNDEECDLPFCFACSLRSKVFFKLTGICEDSVPGSAMIDTDYLLMFGYPHANSYTFRGFTGLTSIYFEEANQRWILNSYRSKVISPHSSFAHVIYICTKARILKSSHSKCHWLFLITLFLPLYNIAFKSRLLFFVDEAQNMIPLCNIFASRFI